MRISHRRLATIIGTVCILAVIAISLVLSRPRQPALTPAELTEGQTTPLYMTTMTHMEGNFKDDRDEDLFNRHIDQLTWAMDLFDEYGGKITVESEQSFAKANVIWERNFLKEIVNRGHGIGTHADFGAETVPKNLAFYIRAFKANKALIDALVGPEHNKGVSGGAGAYDWVTAMAEAGFSYVDGVVGFAYLAMPIGERPNGWTDDYIRATAYHDPAPVDFARRITMYDLADAHDFEADANGVLTISGGELGELSSLAEGRESCSPNCTLTNDDIDVLFQAVLDANTQRSPGTVAKLNVHIPLALYTEENEDVFRYLLSGLEGYASQNLIVWATQEEAYDGYVAQSN